MSTAITASAPSARISRAVRRQVPRSRGGPGVLYFSVILGLTLFFSLSYVWLRMQRIELAYKLSQNRQHEQELDEENRKLLYSLARLKDPNRLEEIARKDLAMRPPLPGQIVILEDPAK